MCKQFAKQNMYIILNRIHKGGLGCLGGCEKLYGCTYVPSVYYATLGSSAILSNGVLPILPL